MPLSLAKETLANEKFFIKQQQQQRKWFWFQVSTNRRRKLKSQIKKLLLSDMKATSRWQSSTSFGSICVVYKGARDIIA